METTNRQPDAAEAARQIIRSSLKAALATLEAGSGFPYASLVTVGFRPSGTPLLLLSRLAVHTRNLEADPRASLLFDASDGAGDPLAGGRVTVVGRLQRLLDTEVVRRRFLPRHPGAQMYVDFPDFGFFEMQIERAHYIGGFGRIVDLGAGDLLTDLRGTQHLVSAEAEIVAHMNEDHADAVGLYATRLAGRPEGDWQMTGIDPAGLDLSNGQCGVRIAFDSPVTTPAEARAALVALAERARAAGYA